MNINNKFAYPALSRDTQPTGERVYFTDWGPASSVTTILGATSVNPGLDSWRAWIGEAKANKIRDEASGLGSLMHEHLENHMLGVERPKGTNLVRTMARNMANEIINKGLVHVDEVWGIEAALHYEDIYAGTADLIGVYKGKPAVMDFKNSIKMKKVDMIGDYFCQCAAYAEAHNWLFNTDIKTIVIFMASRDLQFNAFVVEGEGFDQAVKNWNRRVVKFYSMGLETADLPK